jgi:hypothetical protein
LCLKRSIDFGIQDSGGMPQSFDGKWELVREQNKELEDKSRLESELKKQRNN